LAVTTASAAGDRRVLPDPRHLYDPHHPRGERRSDAEYQCKCRSPVSRLNYEPRTGEAHDDEVSRTSHPIRSRRAARSHLHDRAAVVARTGFTVAAGSGQCACCVCVGYREVVRRYTARRRAHCCLPPTAPGPGVGSLQAGRRESYGRPRPWGKLQFRFRGSDRTHLEFTCFDCTHPRYVCCAGARGFQRASSSLIIIRSRARGGRLKGSFGLLPAPQEGADHGE